MTVESNVNQVMLPMGWAIGPGIESSRTTAANNVQQGLKFPLTGPGGTETSVFIPYSAIGNTAAVAAVINERIGAILAINPGA